MDRGYVLHSYPYRETSLILQAWTEKHGRMGLVAKGARRPKSAHRSLLVPFQPLAIDWFGRGELRTLKTAEPTAPATPLSGASLMAGFYLNELLLKLTHRDDPHEGLFEAYDEAVAALRRLSRRTGDRPLVPPAGTARAESAPQDLETTLRRFELRMLQELGYAVELAREAGTGAAIAAEREYWYVVERGRFDDTATVAQAKQLMRLLINHSLNGQELATRALVRDLQILSPGPTPKAEGGQS